MRKRRRWETQPRQAAEPDLRLNFLRVKKMKKPTKKACEKASKPQLTEDTNTCQRDQLLLSFIWWLSPTRHENEVRLSIYQQVLACLQRVDPMVKLNIFGSFMYGVGIPLSDLDMNICTSHREIRSVRGLGKILRASHAFTEFRILRTAKVPIVKCKHRQTGVSLDFTINNISGEKTGSSAKKLLDVYPASRSIVVFLKYALRRKGLMDVSQGGISSFALCLLTISFLQRLQAPCGFIEMLIGFLCYYGYVFNQSTMGIEVNVAKACAKPVDVGADVLYVLDPTNEKNNVTKGCRIFPKVQQEFRSMHNSLRTILRDRNASAKSVFQHFSIPDHQLMRKRHEMTRYHAGLVDGSLAKLIDERNFVSHVCSSEIVKQCGFLSEKMFARGCIGFDFPSTKKAKKEQEPVSEVVSV